MNWLAILKIVFSPILAGIIAAAAALGGAVGELPAGAQLSDIGQITWLVVGLAALIAGSKDLTTFMAEWPTWRADESASRDDS